MDALPGSAAPQYDAFWLRRRGFSIEEVVRLATLRRSLQRQQRAAAKREHRRLAFARWLVRRGRLRR